MHQNKEIKHVTVHRLVASAFIPNIENKPEVNHIDGIKSNNCDWNLEWSTHSENMQHAYDTGLKKPSQLNKCGFKHHNSKPIIQMDKLGNEIAIFESICIAGKLLNINQSNIIKVCKNKSKYAGGYSWRYLENYTFKKAI